MSEEKIPLHKIESNPKKWALEALQRRETKFRSLEPNIPIKHRELARRAHKKVDRPVFMHIKSYCLSCVCHEDVYRRISFCSAVSCEIWPFRPYQTKEMKESLKEWVKNHK